MKLYLKIGIGVLTGAALGYAYYYFWGCSGGTCPLTSTWYVSTLYGAAAGLFIAMPGKKKEKTEKNEDRDKN